MKNDDATSNDTIKAYLKKVLEHVIAAGHDVSEFSEFILDKFGAAIQPYLRQFLDDVGKGAIKIKGLSEAAKTAIVGQHVNADEREVLVREEAYYLAEKRGFATGHEVEDWVAAEALIESRLAEEAGLIAKGGKALALTATNIENELKKLKSIVTTWLDENYGPVNKAVASGNASVKKVTNTTSTVNQASKQKKTGAKAATQGEGKTTKISTQKKGVKKEPA